MKIESSEFVISAFSPKDEPERPGPDIVFLGRSNVGKSSLINRLLGTRGLARTSSTPGRTQSVNFYRINDTFYMVDLPGYGFARVPEAVRKTWGPMIEGFLDRRAERIALAVLVVDARHEPSKLDKTMQDWLDAKGLHYVVAATKADKLSGNGRTKALKTIQQALGAEHPAGPPLLVSSEKGMGIDKLWRTLDKKLQ